MDKIKRERFLNLLLEEEDFTSILERFDLTPEEVFEYLFLNGLIDPETLSEMMGY